MSKTLGIVAASALLVCATAFAQNAPSSSASPPDQASAPAAAPADESANSEEKSMQKHHRRHAGSTRGNRHTDFNADRLNACNAYAMPTPEQQECLRAAAGTGNS